MTAPIALATCATCHLSIARPQDGWIEWLVTIAGDTIRGHGARIVHHCSASPEGHWPGCQYAIGRGHGTVLMDLPMDWGLGLNPGMDVCCECRGSPRAMGATLRHNGVPEAEVAPIVETLEHARQVLRGARKGTSR